jgi:hypothetical protein
MFIRPREIKMPVVIDGIRYYRTSEACRETSISRATLFRWLKLGILERSCKDRRGWRLFTAEDLIKIQKEASRVEIEVNSGGAKNAKSR